MSNANDELDMALLENLQAPAYEDLHDDDETLWSEILPNLWQGGTDDYDVMSMRSVSENPFITKVHFDTVVTLYASARPVDWFVREIRYGFWDHDMKDFNSEDLFDIVRVAHTDWKNGKRVLIRCQAGWNRSGLITALVLIREGYSARDAIDMQRKRRSEWVLCNEHFERWLLKTDANDWKGNAYGKDK
jgi:protein-tyrosine phosphatase